MKIPIMEPATGVYLDAIRKYIKFRQVPLMSADYILDGKRYKLVGLYKKKLFGGIVNRMLQKFMVVDEHGAVVKDPELSRKLLEYYCTFESLWLCETRIAAALKHDPSFYEEILAEAEGIIPLLIPVMRQFKNGEERNRYLFQQFFSFLKLYNEKSIALEQVARELSAPLSLVLNRQAADEELYKKVKSLVIQFVNNTDIRTMSLIDLYQEGALLSVKLTLSEAERDKTIHLIKYKKSIENIKLIVRESIRAIQTTMMDGISYARTTDLNKIKRVIEERLYPKEDMITDYANEIMNKAWIFHK
ncbi:hypothetical protein ACPVTF_18725 [Geobacillus icigianus]|uniref:Uncharacterized protein n=1 Tax=Geobacillus subterraneus TaxID=129338 RepID=A0A679G1V1_9BACL|nr:MULTISPECIES: hypothetical protein [Geobacillus]KYD27676.1 hypothetical protein B4113_0075 [Geobacillus sp. B4113_201601]BBW97981.1 hypothetical protein GsuE55_28140 [Geobacillus subterraneus]